MKQVTLVTSVSSEIPALRNCCSKLNMANQTLRAILGALYDRTKCHQYWGTYSMSPISKNKWTTKPCFMQASQWYVMFVDLRIFQRQLKLNLLYIGTTFTSLRITYTSLHRRYVMCYENPCFERFCSSKIQQNDWNCRMVITVSINNNHGKNIIFNDIFFYNLVGNF